MNNELPKNLSLSSRKRRIAAFMIDHFVMSILIVSIFFLFIDSNFMDENNVGRMTTLMLAVFLTGFLLYFAKDSIKGISAGKWIMGIMVRDSVDTNKIPSFWRLLARNLFIIIWPVEFIVLASSYQKKRVGDIIANTVVVKNPNKPSKLPRILALIAVVIVNFIFVIVFASMAFKKTDAYKVAITEIEHHTEIISETGGIKGYGTIPTGEISLINGHGVAKFGINIIGVEEDISVIVYLEKEPNNEWEVVELNKIE